MNNRMTTPSAPGRTAFGLIAWLEQTKITLPLKGVECVFNVCGDVVSVELDQIFHQNSSQPLDCLYSFPLPAGAAVYRCEMHVNGRVIRAKVEERERAREIVREKKAAGYRTALVEMERDNLFTLALGNVQPNDLVVIRFAYFQTLSRLGDWTSFRIPFCPGIRYIPGTPLLRSPKGRGAADDTDQVPDASRVSPPRMDRLHAGAAYVSVEGTVEHPLDDVRDLSSPTHPVLVKPVKGQSHISIADQTAVPESDFILRWTETDTNHVKPTGWIARCQDDLFALLRLRAPMQAPAAKTYSQDIYFLIDRSGSMKGLKWQKAVEAFRAFLKVLGPLDRVWATFFESGVRDLAEKPLPPAELLADGAVKHIESLGVDGGTELLPALEHILAKIAAHSNGRPASLLLITDGQIGNEDHVLRRLSSHASLRVHVFGIDITINDGFLNQLAARHHGTACLLAPTDDIVGAVSRLGDRLRRPVFTSIHVQDGWELADENIPDLHAGEILSLPLRLRRSPEPGAHVVAIASPPVPREITIASKLPDGSSHTLRFELTESSATAVHLLWARRRIDFLLAKGDTTAAISLAKESNLVCEGAAFVAWDEAEKVQVSVQEVYQPAMEPHLAKLAFACRSVGAASMGLLEESAGASYSQSKHSSLSSSIQGFVSRLRGKRESEPPPPFSSWREQLERDVLFQNPEGVQFLDCLVGWMRSQPRQAELCQLKIEQLLHSLRRAAGPPASRLEAVRRWVERELEAPFRAQALARLKALESARQIQTQSTTQ